MTQYNNRITSISPNKIHVLHIITRMIIGGAQENTMYTTAMLDPNIFDVTLISGPQTGKEGSLFDEALSYGVNIQILPELVRELSPIKDIIALFKLYIYIKKQKFDIVHTHSSKAGIIGRIAAKLAGVPIIIHTIHGWSFHDYMSPLLRKFYVILERTTARITDHLVAVTNKDIEKGLKSRIGLPHQYLLIRSSIPLESFTRSAQTRLEIRESFRIPQDAFVVGTISRLSPQKNPLDWVEIASIISKNMPNVFFLFVGDGPLREAFEHMLLESGIHQKTIMTGLRRDVGKLLNGMDIFLLTSLWEGLPRVIPQAMCVGVPVVAYGVDGIAEIIQTPKNGWLIPPNDIQKAAEACLELLRSPELREKISAEAYEFATVQFDIRNMINQLEKLYLENIPRRKGQ